MLTVGKDRVIVYRVLLLKVYSIMNPIKSSLSTINFFFTKILSASRLTSHSSKSARESSRPPSYIFYYLPSFYFTSVSFSSSSTEIASHSAGPKWHQSWSRFFRYLKDSFISSLQGMPALCNITPLAARLSSPPPSLYYLRDSSQLAATDAYLTNVHMQRCMQLHLRLPCVEAPYRPSECTCKKQQLQQQQMGQRHVAICHADAAATREALELPPFVRFCCCFFPWLMSITQRLIAHLSTSETRRDSSYTFPHNPISFSTTPHSPLAQPLATLQLPAAAAFEEN